MDIKLLICTHNDFGRELYKTVQDIMGSKDGIKVYSVFNCQPVEQIKENFKKLLNSLLKKNSVLILTDILGGTPTNIAMPFLKNKNVELVTGVNLPMLITAIHKKNELQDVRKLAQVVGNSGKKSIVECRSHINS